MPFLFLLENLEMNICMLYVFVLGFSVNGNPSVDRSVVFDDFRPKSKFMGHKIKTLPFISKRKCAYICLQNPICTSFNYFIYRRCDLFSDDQFTHERQMVYDRFSNYHGMRNDTFPVCSEKGYPRNIQNDSDPNLCQINRKRMDTSWGPWQWDLEVDNNSEWKNRTWRDCLPAFHGGVISCNVPEEMFEWFKFFKTLFHFSDANEACRSFGGNLFSDICSNTIEQRLKLFDLKLEQPVCFWVGLSYDHVQDVWLTMEGNQLPQGCSIIWGSDQPDGPSAEENRMGGFRMNGLFDNLHDVLDTDVCSYVCDISY